MDCRRSFILVICFAGASTIGCENSLLPPRQPSLVSRAAPTSNDPAQTTSGSEPKKLGSVRTVSAEIPGLRQWPPVEIAAHVNESIEANAYAPKTGREARTILRQAMKAYETKLAVIGHNLANAQTVAYKPLRVVFEDVSYRNVVPPGSVDSAGQVATTGIALGFGMRIACTQSLFDQGTIRKTNNALDLAIDGDGFFQVTDANGDTLYTRAGNFVPNADGALVLGSATSGRLMEPSFTLPSDAEQIVVSPDGSFQVRQFGMSALSLLGQIQLASFVNPVGLERIGENLFRETDASGSATVCAPGQNGVGKLRQFAVEMSGVDVEQEMSEWRLTEELLGHLARLMEGNGT